MRGWVPFCVLLGACGGDPASVGLGRLGSKLSPDPRPLWRETAEHGGFASFLLDEAAIDADGALVIADGGGHAGTDPFGPGMWQGGSYYDGGSFRLATAISPAHASAQNFNEVVPSFEADTPPGTWIEIDLRARIGGRWTQSYVLGIWAFDEGTVRRHSVRGQNDADGEVQTDTLVLTQRADALEMTAVLFSEAPDITPRVRALSAIVKDTAAPAPVDPPDQSVWGTVLDVPMRSQMIYPGGGEVWCSPTSTSMLLAYWSNQLRDPGLAETVPLAAGAVYDWIYGGAGNWPFNTAHAAHLSHGSVHGFVTRMGSFSQVERLIQAGVPVAISVAYGPGALHGSPISSTNGHLLVVRGFAQNGDVVANDPAFPSDDTVMVTYDRAELERAWTHSQKTAYVLYPRGTDLPPDPLGAF